MGLVAHLYDDCCSLSSGVIVRALLVAMLPTATWHLLLV